MGEEKIGRVDDFFSHVSVAAITVENSGVKVGDKLKIKGHTTDVTFTVESMQIEHNNVDQAAVGDEVGIKVPEKVRKHDTVYKVT